MLASCQKATLGVKSTQPDRPSEPTIAHGTSARGKIGFLARCVCRSCRRMRLGMARATAKTVRRSAGTLALQRRFHDEPARSSRVDLYTVYLPKAAGRDLEHPSKHRLCRVRHSLPNARDRCVGRG